MAGNRRHDSPGVEDGTPGFFRRWSERKRAGTEDAEHRESVEPSPEAERADAGVAHHVLTDEDMPPLETLDEESDYSGFLSPGVSESLQRLAMRKLFSSAKFQVRDGLDDYDNDYNLLVPLRRTVAEAVRDEVSAHVRRDVEEKIIIAEASDGATGREPVPDVAEGRGREAAREAPAGKDQEPEQ